MKLRCILPIFLLCSLPSQAQSITGIEIHYIPWNVSTNGKMEEADFRTLDNSHYFRIHEDSALLEFENTLPITNFEKTNLKQMDTRMIIDAHYSNGDTATFLVSYNFMMNGPGMVQFENSYFLRNRALSDWILKYVPVKKSLKGEYITIKSEPNAYTQEEIDTLKAQGVIVIFEEE